MPEPTKTKAPLVLIDPANIIFLGQLNAGSQHRHAATVCLVGLEKPLHIKLEADGDSTQAQSAVIPADCRHWLDPQGGLTAVIYSEIYTPRYKLMQPQQVHAPEFDLPGTAELQARLKQLYTGEQPTAHAINALDAALSQVLGGRVTTASDIDPRVYKAIDHIQGRISEQPIELSDIASLLNISPSRLQHLFRKELGVGFSRMQAWLRLRQAINHFPNGRSVTHAALEAGFSSSSYFSHAFRSMFGVSIRETLLPSNNVGFYPLDWD